MEFKSEFSRIELLEDKLKSETSNFFKSNREKTFNTIKYDNIKGFKIGNWGFIKYIFFVAGLISVGMGFKSDKYEINGIVLYTHNPTTEQIITGIFFGVILVILGILFDKKYAKYKSLSLEVFEGKDKLIHVFTSQEEKEIVEIRREIEKKIYK